MSVRLNQASDTEGTLPLLEQITLSEFVSQLIQLSDQDRDELQQHSAEECEAEVNRLVQLVQDPSRGTLTVQETVGRLFMLQHRQADLEIKALRAEIKALNRSNERLNSEVQDLRHDLKRAPDALEEHTSKLDESELSQAAATSSLSHGNSQELPASRPGHQARVSVTSSLRDSLKEREHSVSEDETEYYGSVSRDSRRGLARRQDAHSRHGSRDRSPSREEKRRSGLLPPFLPSRRREQEVHFEASPSLHGDRSMSCGRRSVRYDSASPPRRSRDTLRYDSASPPRRSRDASHNKSASLQRRRRDTSRTHVTLMTQIDNPPMHEIRRIAQVAWETVAHTGDRRDEDPKFPGDLIQKSNAKRIYTAVLGGNCLDLKALLDTGSEISLMCSNMLTEIPKRTLTIGRRLWVHTCNHSLTSYTQDQAPITHRARLEVTFPEMKDPHPVRISKAPTEPQPVDQKLLGELASSPVDGEVNPSSLEEPNYLCQGGEVQKQLTKAGALGTDTQRQELRHLVYDPQAICTRDNDALCTLPQSWAPYPHLCISTRSLNGRRAT
ncbi:hypothetical protein SKAU_G00324100 [Synaphobranchus kaupii]|uniref:Uncharacterized protein n=1 Tax=Synaphobranchus kaupii TaxID=118154 RepID=A0A9Q1IJU7_SYNKA|nr:hypothetical protein SKAU_G00324100 [Synaphobranchus kaupii]